MNGSKRRSRRLALYLLCIGVRPWAAGLQTQYNALEPGQRKLARKTGRRLIKLSPLVRYRWGDVKAFMTGLSTDPPSHPPR